MSISSVVRKRQSGEVWRLSIVKGQSKHRMKSRAPSSRRSIGFGLCALSEVAEGLRGLWTIL